MATKYADLTLDAAVKFAKGDTQAEDLLMQLHTRKSRVEVQMQKFRDWCDRADALYYTDDITAGGADLWADHPSVRLAGRSHVSVNTPAAYVDIPAALQAVEPIENMLATDTTPESRSAAQAMERIYYAWKAREQFELKSHKACTVKGLYGRTAARIYWKPAEKADEKGYPCIEIIDQPRNLYLGWKTTAYDELSWAAYVQKMTPDAVIEEFSVDLEARELPGSRDTKIVPFVRAPESTLQLQTSRSWLDFGEAMIEVWDYWFLKPKGELGERGSKTKMTVWNAVFAGNELVRYAEYPEYGGRLPIVPLFNTYIPGVPDGRPDLYDPEQIIREKYERITSGSQMIAAGVGGNFWQLIGPETTTGLVPPQVRPRINEVISPGPNARIESITPFIPEMQLEQHLNRLDYELVTITGLNDLLTGHAPAQVLSSSKAINALIANYESRLSIRRGLLYAWRKSVWELAIAIWADKDETIKQVVDAGGGTLDITDPSLSPRDDMETATRALNLVNGQLWAASRGMDAVGVDDPESEQDIIREENTDATLNPAKVQVMAQLMAALSQLGLQAPQGAQAQAQAQLASGQNDLRNALAGATPTNSTSSQLGGDQGVLPPEAATPGPAGAPGPIGGGGDLLAQSMIQNGEAKSRILSQQKIPAKGRPY